MRERERDDILTHKENTTKKCSATINNPSQFKGCLFVRVRIPKANPVSVLC